MPVPLACGERSAAARRAGDSAGVDADEALRHLGGVASAAELVALSSRRRVRTAAGKGRIVKVGRAGYALPDLDRHRRVAAAMSATLSHLSAAQHWGWAVKTPPEAAWVTVPRHRKVSADVRATTRVAHADLAAADVLGGHNWSIRRGME